MENIEIARVLAETADLMEIAAEDGFRIRSYRNAASAVEGYPERIASILHDPARKVTDIPGIGKGIAAVITELDARGSFAKRDELMERYPPTALEMLHIQGLGPKTIALLIETFRISTLDDLKRLAEEQKIRTLPRLGAKLEEKVLRGIEQYRKSAGRFLLNFAQQTADELSAYLGAVDGVARVTPAGSFRRSKDTVGDLDLLVTGPGAAAVQPVKPGTGAPRQTVRWPGIERATPFPAAPSVRRYARGLGGDITVVDGTGPGGRIGNADVKQFVRDAMLGGGSGGGAAKGVPLPDFSKWGAVEAKPMSNIRRKPAEHPPAAWATFPHVQQNDKADVTDAVAVEAVRP